jgi:hypothetical protein
MAMKNWWAPCDGFTVAQQLLALLRGLGANQGDRMRLFGIRLFSYVYHYLVNRNPDCVFSRSIFFSQIGIWTLSCTDHAFE